MAEKSPSKAVMAKMARCLICNGRAPSTGRNAITISGNTSYLKSNGKSLLFIIQELVDKTIKIEVSHSEVICKKCFKKCAEYNDIFTRAQNIKKDILSKFKATLKSNGLSYEMFEESPIVDMSILKPTCKLSPLPSNLVIVNKGNKIVLNDKNKKVNIQSIQEIKVEKVKQEIPLVQNDNETLESTFKSSNKNTFVIDDVEIAPDNDNLELDENTILLEEDENGSILRVLHGGIELKDKQISYNAESNEIELVSLPSDNESDSLSDDNESKNVLLDLKSMAKKDQLKEIEEEHVATLIEFNGTDYKCLVCDRKKETFIGRVDSITAHMKNKHNARVFICKRCGHNFKRRFLLTTHLATVHGAADNSLGKPALRKHACTKCYKSFNSKGQLEDHLHLHLGERPHTCEVCNKSFASKYTKATHMKTHLERPRPFKCDKCEKSFLTMNNLICHMRTHESGRDFFCKVCQKGFSSQHNLEMHSLVHTGEKKFRCHFCDKAFMRKPELRDHIRIHTNERPFVCKACGASFRQRSNLNSHHRATHLNVRPHKCPHCDKTFKRRRLVEYHCKSAHTFERPLKCETCDATFIYPEHYRKHMTIHTGEKPYKCEVCGKQFNSRDNRNAHRFVHSDKKPYECLVCGAGFMRRPLLYSHMNQQDHVTDTIVVNRPKLVGSENDLEITFDVENSDKEMDESPEMECSQEQVNFNEYLLQSEGNMQDDGVNQYILSANEESGASETKPQFFVANTTATDGQAVLNIGEPLIEMKQQEDDCHQILLTGANGEVLTADGSKGTLRIMSVQLPGGEDGWVAVKAT